jgi:hypothetical protein
VSNRNTEKEEMNKTKTRCLSLALAIGVLALFGSTVATAQDHTTGFNVTKTCPMDPVAQGAMFSCDFSITNQDPDHSVGLTSVTNTFPWIAPGDLGNGPATPVDCMQGGSPVTVLGAAGSGTAQCGGTVVETAPDDCNPADRQVNDRIAVMGTDQGPSPFTGLPASGSTVNGPLVLGQICNDGEFCRTKGFWGTHVNESDDLCAQNITQAVIDAGGPLDICGESLCTTVADDSSSAIEALCNTGGGERQLAAQLTAAALNCIVTNGSADCTGVSIEDAFQACNTACATNVDADATNDVSLGDCIAVIDCFNNGGQWDDVNDFCATGTCPAPIVMKTAGDGPAPTAFCTPNDLSNCAAGTTECTPFENNCHDADFGDFEFVTLPNDVDEEGVCFGKPGPADPTECKAARKSGCLIWNNACEDSTDCAAP